MTAARYVTVRGQRYRLKTEAERRASKRQRGTSGRGATISIPRPPLAAATPRGYARYARGNRVPAALLLFAVIVGIRILRRGGQMPAARETVGLLISALVIAVAASFVPELVIAFLLALAFVVAIDETDRIVAATNWLTGLLGTPPRNPFGTHNPLGAQR